MALAGDRARSRGGHMGAQWSRPWDRGHPVGCRVDGGRFVGMGAHTWDLVEGHRAVRTRPPGKLLVSHSLDHCFT